MERVKRIFQSLSKAEVRYLKKYLGAFHHKGSNKALEMLHLMEKKPNISQGEISRKLYNDPKSKAFIMLKARVLEKMLETLSLSVNFHNNPVYKDDPVAFGSIEIMKELTYAIMMRKRGLTDLAKDILEKCLKKAKDLCIPEFQLQALTYLQNITTSEKELNHYNQDLWEAQERYHVDLKGICIFDAYRVYISDQRAGEVNINDFLEVQLSELKLSLDTHYSKRAHYYYLYLKGHLHEFNNEYEKSKEVLEEMIKLFDEHKGLQSKNRMATPHIQLSYLELSMGKFETARKAASKAMEIVPPNTQNYITATLYRFIACLYLGDYEEGNYITSILNNLEHLPDRNRLQELAFYIMSCHEYLAGNYSKAIHLFYQIENLFSDKKSWNISLRIHEILLLIDMHKLDLASSKIETLRKHVSRYEPDQRTQLIYKYLYLLDKYSFHFEQNSTDQVEILQALDKANAWNPLSNEIIKFDVWLEAKKTQKPLREILKRSLSKLSILHN